MSTYISNGDTARRTRWRTIWRRNIVLVSLLLLVAAPAFAQSHDDVVAAVKAELEARHVDLSGPCGAFAITKRVAWRLRNDGAGLLPKSGGTNCEGYSTD